MDLLDAPASEWIPLGVPPGQFRVYEATPANVGAARRYVRKWLQLMELGHLIDRAQEVASELATNAVRHATGPGAADRFAVRLTLVRGVVLIDVMDHSPQRPIVRSPDDIDETGRGMLLVDAITDAWECFTWEVRGDVVKVVRAGFRAI
jgi:anti-sigma regulatory factor (Ser/Thr protein kinase)